MRSISKLNFGDSIEKKKLVFHENWMDKFDRYAIYLFFSFGALQPFLAYYDPHRIRAHTGVGYYMLFIISAFSIFVIYKKATEKHLRTIKTSFDKETNRTLIVDYLKKQGFDYQRNSNNIIVFTEPTDDFWPGYKKSRIFLLKDNEVYFTIIQDRKSFNVPVLVSHYFLRKDLKKILCK